MRQQNTYARGFSLVELMVAMTITLIVTGAIYGLMTGGQEAFRREPEVTDRQQNIRLAMDVIMRDIASAGAAMPPFTQTFRPGLNSCAGCPAAAHRTGPGVPAVPGGPQTDDLEIMANPGGMGMEEACNYSGHESNARFVASSTSIGRGDVFMVLLADGTWTLRAAIDDPSANNGQPGDCMPGLHAAISFRSGGDTTGYNLPSGVCAGDQVMVGGVCSGCTDGGQPIPGNACCSAGIPAEDIDPCTVEGFLQAEMVRYRVRTDAAGVPNLERWSSGSSASFGAGGAPIFQVIARGIDDLQVEYFDANGARWDDAPQVDQGALNYGSLIQRVRVTLSSRSESVNVAGASRVDAGPVALRGRLIATGTPRAALDTLGTRVTQRKPGASTLGWF